MPQSPGRTANPFDVSDGRLIAEDSWREPFAWLRANAPVSWREESPFGGYWSIVTPEHIEAVSLDTGRFSSAAINGGIALDDVPIEFCLPSFIATDPPEHTRPRKVFFSAFSPSQMQLRQVAVRRLTREILDGLPFGESFDWVERVSIPLTVGLLCTLFDLPLDEAADLKLWSDVLSNPVATTPEDIARLRTESGRLLQRFDALIADRKAAAPADDLLSRIAHSEELGDMSADERLGHLSILIIGGNDTTRNTMSGLVDAFDRYPDQLELLHRDRSLIANAANEIIRWQSTVTFMRRTATEDAVVNNQLIRKGEKVALWYLSANRDESLFADAERFDVSRANARRHLAFGHGPHRCIGARLAEMQVAVLIEEIVERGLRIVPRSDPVRGDRSISRSIQSYPVQLATA